MNTLRNARLYRIAMVCMIISLVFGLLAACSSDNIEKKMDEPQKSDNEKVKSGEENEAEVSKKLERLEISAMVRSFNVDMPDPKDDFIKHAIEEKFNVDLKIEPVLDAQLKQKAGAYFASASYPDVVAFRGFEHEFVKQGLFLPLDGYLDLAPNFTGNWPENERGLWTFQEDQKIYAVPQLRLGKMHALWIRKDWLDAVNTSIPDNMQELADAAYAFAKKDPDGNNEDDTYGYFFAGNGGKGLGAIALFQRHLGVQFNSPYLLKDNSIIFNQFSDANRDALKFLKEQILDRSSDPNWFFAKNADQTNMLHAGKIGIVNAHVDSFFKLTKGYDKADKPIPGDWIPLPHIKNLSGKQTKFKVNPFPLRSFYLTKDVSKEKAERFMQILEWMATPGEGYELITYGREGIEYKKNGDKIEVIKSPEESAQQWRDNYRWYHNDKDPFWLAGLPQDIIKANETMINRWNSEDYDKRAVNHLQERGSSFFDHFEIADFNRFYNEALFEFLIGKRSFDEWDKFEEEGNKTFYWHEYVDFNTNRIKDIMGVN